MLDLSLLLDYDLWATRRWLLAVGGFQNLGHAHEIVEHMLLAQRIWLERLGVEIPAPGGTVAIEQLFETMNGIWRHVVEDGNPDAVIAYTTTQGETFRNTVREIVSHVVNHGTYHRGQLRGLADAEGFQGFPETDLILYLRTAG